MCREKVHAEVRSRGATRITTKGTKGTKKGSRECAQNTFVCFVLFVVNNPLRVSA
jgi:hypothetical protein